MKIQCTNGNNETVELMKALTTNTEISNIIDEVFSQDVECIADVLVALKERAIKDNIKELLDIVDKIESTLDKTTLEKKFFLVSVNGIELDRRVINADEITNFIKCIGFNPSRNNYYDYRDNTYKDKNDLARHIKRTFLVLDEITKIKANAYYSKSKYQDPEGYLKYVMNAVIAQIRDNNQYGQVSYSVNPFLKEEIVTFKNQIMHITYNEVLPKVIPLIEDEKILKDYLEHFPDFHIFLDFLLAVRFGADKKRGYIWLRAISNWGKSFLVGGVLGNLGLVVEIDESALKSAYSGSASGFTAEMFINAWVVFMDEFKSAVSELKKITHSLSFSPKFKGQITVEVFLKVCASAESVKSLVNDGAMEAQFQNRFLNWREASGKLSKRALFLKDKYYYLKVITSYTYEYLRKESDIYIGLGEANASIKANGIMNEVYLKKQTSTSSKEEVMARNLEEFKLIYMENRFGLSPYYFEDKQGNVFIKIKVKFVEAFLREYYGQDEAGQLNRYKETNVILGLGENPERKTINIAGKRETGYLWIPKAIVSDSVNSNPINNEWIDNIAIATA
jgi:hypothetical protein